MRRSKGGNRIPNACVGLFSKLGSIPNRIALFKTWGKEVKMFPLGDPHLGILWGLAFAAIGAFVWANQMSRGFFSTSAYRTAAGAVGIATFIIWMLAFFFPSLPMEAGASNEAMMMLAP